MKKHLSYLLILFLFFISCDSGGSSDSKDEGIKLDISEPSGLAISPDGQNLWIISDSKKTVYKTDTGGNILSQFKVEITEEEEEDDDDDVKILEGMEGISYDDSTDPPTLWICLEEAGVIANVDLEGNVITQKKVKKIFEAELKYDDNTDYDYKKDNGMEGIAVDADYIYLIIEKGDFIKLNKNVFINSDLEADPSGLIKDWIVLTFSGEDNDYSGAFLGNDGSLWVTSHEAMAVYKWDMISGDSAERVYSSKDFDIKQLEGIAIDFTNEKVYLCSDKDSRLYIRDLK